MRFVRLNLYFFTMYSLLTAVWYGLRGKFNTSTSQEVIGEIMLNAAIFSLLFSVTILLLYRRTSIRIPVSKYKLKELQQKLEENGFLKTVVTAQNLQVYKPTPPKAPALAGKVFLAQTKNFYLIQGPSKYLKGL
ncbi:hypothetical protein [Pontibacter rugosus]|uniref:Poly-beta-1,6-N-acetyl-D-glucosamine biosynthesis protein PgaD n=1 Tax=Pontibacter rugosus TaxID=1745966 RepID=A0ABW3SPU2_9BACT